MNALTSEVAAFLKERHWDRLKPSDLAKSVSIEAAELLEIFQWEDVSIEAALADPERMARIKMELADVMIYCLQMATLLDLDVEEIVRAKQAHNALKFPAEKIAALKDDPVTREKLMREIKSHYRANQN